MRIALIFCCVVVLEGCIPERENPEEIRHFYMGFMNSSPRPGDLDLTLQSLEIWTLRADAAIISTEVPWDSLLAGQSSKSYVVNHYAGLTDYYRSKGMALWVYVDPQNGLDRTSDALALQAAGHSIAEADMQALYIQFAIAMDSVLKPEHLGLALETNLIRDASTQSIYQGIKYAANQAAVALRARDSQAKLSISVQVDHAWGKLAGGNYQGIDVDLVDFHFIDELGFSSYPYFGFDDPADIPLDYYSRLGSNVPVFISEGGYASTSVPNAFTSSPEMQRRYISKQLSLLQSVNGIAVFQLIFTDIDISSIPDPIPPNLKYFTDIGLVDINLQPKPALEAWDFVYALRRRSY